MLQRTRVPERLLVHTISYHKGSSLSFQLVSLEPAPSCRNQLSRAKKKRPSLQFSSWLLLWLLLSDTRTCSLLRGNACCGEMLRNGTCGRLCLQPCRPVYWGRGGDICKEHEMSILSLNILITFLLFLYNISISVHHRRARNNMPVSVYLINV